MSIKRTFFYTCCFLFFLTTIPGCQVTDTTQPQSSPTPNKFADSITEDTASSAMEKTKLSSTPTAIDRTSASKLEKNTTGHLRKGFALFHAKNGTIVQVALEIAETQEQRERGLMFRDSLDQDSGMLFVYPLEESQTFWMKNVSFPLEIIFLNKEKKIVDIKEAEPCMQKKTCPTYSPQRGAQYVIEVNKGFTEEHGILLGDTVILPFLENEHADSRE